MFSLFCAKNRPAASCFKDCGGSADSSASQAKLSTFFLPYFSLIWPLPSRRLFLKTARTGATCNKKTAKARTNLATPLSLCFYYSPAAGVCPAFAEKIFVSPQWLVENFGFLRLDAHNALTSPAVFALSSALTVLRRQKISLYPGDGLTSPKVFCLSCVPAFSEVFLSDPSPTSHSGENFYDLSAAETFRKRSSLRRCRFIFVSV